MQRIIVKVNPAVDSITNPFTRAKYAEHMKQFLDTNPPSDNEELEQHIIGYLVGMEQNGILSAFRKQAYAAIHKYYTTKPNKKLLDWDNIKLYLGNEHISTGKKIGYKSDKIEKLLKVSVVTDKCKIFLLAMGMRRGAMCDIKLSDMEYLSDHEIYVIKIYRNTPKEQITFTTPETSRAIQTYIAKEKPQDKGIWLFPARPVKDQTTGEVKANLKGKQISRGSISVRLIELSKLAGLRVGTNKVAHREDTPAVHGLRHFAISAYKKAKIPEELRKILVGHSIGKTQAAYDETLTDDDLFNNLLAEFKRAIPFLTIDQSNKLQTEVTELKKAKSEIESLKDQLKSVQSNVRQQVEKELMTTMDLYFKDPNNKLQKELVQPLLGEISRLKAVEQQYKGHLEHIAPQIDEMKEQMHELNVKLNKAMAMATRKKL